MQKFKVLLIIIVSLTFFTACSTTAPSSHIMRSSLNPKSEQSSRLLIKSAKLELEVEEPKVAVSKIEKIVSLDM